MLYLGFWSIFANFRVFGLFSVQISHNLVQIASQFCLLCFRFGWLLPAFALLLPCFQSFQLQIYDFLRYLRFLIRYYASDLSLSLSLAVGAIGAA